MGCKCAFNFQHIIFEATTMKGCITCSTIMFLNIIKHLKRQCIHVTKHVSGELPKYTIIYSFVMLAKVTFMYILRSHSLALLGIDCCKSICNCINTNSGGQLVHLVIQMGKTRRQFIFYANFFFLRSCMTIFFFSN